MTLEAAVDPCTTSSSVPRPMFIVEDEVLLLSVLEDVGAELGWTIAGGARDEGTALRVLAGIRPSVAVIDINLGLSTGFGVSAACHARAIPVLFVTGFTGEDIPRECGDDPILAKPFSINDFARALDRCVSRQDATVV